MEDNALNQRLIQLILERLGYRAEMAGNGREAVEAWAARKHDIIFMDFHMPEMDGNSATREIRKRESPEERTFIVAMTADTGKDSREKFLDAGMDGVLTKPILIEDVKAMVAAALKGIKREGLS